MEFTKMQGIGNDYVYVNCLHHHIDNPSEVSRFISDRHYGIGSDGLILIKHSDTSDFKMEIYNADGSQAEMCGNGIRCVGKYVYDNKLTSKTSLCIETLGGIKHLELHLGEDPCSRHYNLVDSVTVDMGSPELTPSRIPVSDDVTKAAGSSVVSYPVELACGSYEITCVSMGNPHCIVFTDSVDDINLEEIGPLFENSSIFPERTNTEFVQIIDDKTIKMRVWERGAGETYACGTGACASTVACILNKKTGRQIKVNMLGGSLQISWDSESGKVFMTGPAETVFTGEIDI